jgi:hypothetical protein
VTSRDSYPLLRVEYSTKCDRIRKVLDPEISRFREFRIGIDLLFGGEVRLRDDRLRVDDEIGIFSQILRIMSDRDLESLTSEYIEKW